MNKILWILTLSSMMALLFFEIFLRYSPFEYGASPVVYDDKIGMWHKKGFENYTIKECYKTKYIFNDQGLPSNIYKYDKTKKDVIILGDSYIEAIMVKNKNIIHNSLAKEYHNKYNFMNYGLSGSSPTQQFVILRDKINLENTNYVIQFIELEGDLQGVDSKNLDSLARPKVYVEFDTLDKYKIISPRAKTLYDSVRDFLGDYQIYFFIKKSLYYLRNTMLSQKDNSIKKPFEKEEQKNFTKNWLYLKGAIHQINKNIKLANKNIKYQVVVTSNNERNKRILKRFLDAENIKFIFLNDVAKNMNTKLEGFKLANQGACDGHWNDKTHINIAKIIKEIGFIR